jgi:hypothetical protein
MAPERPAPSARARLVLLALATASALAIRFSILSWAGGWPFEVAIALGLWWLSGRFASLPAWQRAAYCVAATSFGRLGEPTWLPSLARVTSFADLATGAPLSAMAGDDAGGVSLLGLMVGAALMLMLVLRSGAFWVGLALSLVGSWLALRLGRGPALRAVGCAVLALGVLCSGLTLWSSVTRPALAKYVQGSVKAVAARTHVDLGRWPLTAQLEIERTHPAGVALRRGRLLSCSSAGDADAPLSLSRWERHGWLLLEQGRTRLVIDEASLRCVWPTQTALSFQARLPPGYVLSSLLGTTLASLALLLRRRALERSWFLLAGAMAALVPLVISLAAFL